MDLPKIDLVAIVTFATNGTVTGRSWSNTKNKFMLWLTQDRGKASD